jgi:hypothetical protein
MVHGGEALLEIGLGKRADPGFGIHEIIGCLEGSGAA